MNEKHSRRPRGSIYERPDSPFLWIAYSCNGRKIRENSKTTNQRKAQRLLDKRLGEIAEGRFVSLDVGKTTVRELAAFVIVSDDYHPIWPIRSRIIAL